MNWISYNVVAVLGLSAQACSLTAYDHKEKIAFATLRTPNGHWVDERILASALTTKFVGDAQGLSGLNVYVSSLGGGCDTNSSVLVRCSIPESSVICMNTYLNIEATMIDPTNAPAETPLIRQIQVKRFSDGC